MSAEIYSQIKQMIYGRHTNQHAMRCRSVMTENYTEQEPTKFLKITIAVKIYKALK